MIAKLRGHSSNSGLLDCYLGETISTELAKATIAGTRLELEHQIWTTERDNLAYPSGLMAGKYTFILPRQRRGKAWILIYEALTASESYHPLPFPPFPSLSFACKTQAGGRVTRLLYGIPSERCRLLIYEGGRLCFSPFSQFIHHQSLHDNI